MYAIVYLMAAFSLLMYGISPSHRAKCHERWKQPPTHRVIFEIGRGIIGLIMLGTIVAVIIISSRSSK